MITNYSISQIKKNTDIKNIFKNAKLNNLDISCNILNANFTLDSFNYFPIYENEYTFKDLYKRNQSIEHFYSKSFYQNYKSELEKMKNFNNIFLLGSNPADNYYSNLIEFLPRLFFNKDKNIKIAIHRNLSNKFRKFIKKISSFSEINFSFVYLDDNFYQFNNSNFPQFLSLEKSIKILKNFLKPSFNSQLDKKIFITRGDSVYRKIINEADLISVLKSKGYKIINPQHYEIEEQIQIFSNAEKIISPSGSNLTNIIFCKPGTELIEICPRLNEKHENYLIKRYQILAELNKLNYKRIYVDSIDVNSHSDLAIKYLNTKYLKKSNYYKDIIVKIKDFTSLE